MSAAVVTIDYVRDRDGHNVGVGVCVVGVRGIEADSLRRFENFLAVVAQQRTERHPLSSFDVESALRAASVQAAVRWRQ